MTKQSAHQPSLDGFDVHPTDRLFFAVFPPSETAALISERSGRAVRNHGLRGDPVARDRLHVTLNHLGDYAGVPRGIVARASEAAASITAPPFDVTFDRLASFPGKPGKSLLVLRGGVEGLVALDAFQRFLGEGMSRAGLAKWVEKRFTPHITLFYGDRSLDEQAIEPVSWTVRELVLVHSLLGKTQHVILARWPLIG